MITLSPFAVYFRRRRSIPNEKSLGKLKLKSNESLLKASLSSEKNKDIIFDQRKMISNQSLPKVPQVRASVANLSKPFSPSSDAKVGSLFPVKNSLLRCRAQMITPMDMIEGTFVVTPTMIRFVGLVEPKVPSSINRLTGVPDSADSEETYPGELNFSRFSPLPISVNRCCFAANSLK